MLQIKKGKITFPIYRGGPQIEDRIESFPRKIQDFTVGLTGFELEFVKDDGKADEHPIHLANVDVQSTRIDDNTIEVMCTLKLRDASKYYDDYYTGYVAYAVVALMEEAPPMMKLSGFVHSLKTISSSTARSLLVQLYIPIEERLVDLTFDLSSPNPTDLVLTALLRDALALSLPIACEVVPSSDSQKEQYTLADVEIKTRKTYHQAEWEISEGQFQKTGDIQIGTVHGKVTAISVGAFGLLKETNDDLPDVAQVIVTGIGKMINQDIGKMINQDIGKMKKQETELFLGLQRADLDTNISILTMLLDAYREDREVTVNYYLGPLCRSDTTQVKWIQCVQLGK